MIFPFLFQRIINKKLFNQKTIHYSKFSSFQEENSIIYLRSNCLVALQLQTRIKKTCWFHQTSENKYMPFLERKVIRQRLYNKYEKIDSRELDFFQ